MSGGNFQIDDFFAMYMCVPIISKAVRSVLFGSSAILSICCLSDQRCIVGCGELCYQQTALLYSPFFKADGTCTVWSSENHALLRLTGVGIDHVTSITVSGDFVYTSCRDGKIRTYHTEPLY